MPRVGLISDTHGLLRPQAVAFLRGSDFIIHAGDIGRPDVLGHLMALAPVFAVRGNVDGGAWAASLPDTEDLTIGGHKVHVLHALNDLAINPETHGIAAVIYGHTHQPLIEKKGGVLYINPGSAGPRRFRLPVTVANLSVEDGKLKAAIIDLKV